MGAKLDCSKSKHLSRPAETAENPTTLLRLFVTFRTAKCDEGKLSGKTSLKAQKKSPGPLTRLFPPLIYLSPQGELMKERTLPLHPMIFDNLVGAPDNSFVIGAFGRQYGRFLDQNSMSAVSQTFFATEVGELALSKPVTLVVGTSSRFFEGFDPGSE